jgi:hypothetical protein
MIAPDFASAIFVLYPTAVIVSGDTLESCTVKDAEGNQVSIDNAAVNSKLTELEAQYVLDCCKSKAQQLLYFTDWTTIPDVANPENNPYLMNQAAFIAYRNQLRQLAVNPVANPVWPTQPTEQWSS